MSGQHQHVVATFVISFIPSMNGHPISRTISLASSKLRQLLPLAGFTLALSSLSASDLVEVMPLTDRVVLLHFDDGTATYHKRGESRETESVTVDPLDVTSASLPATYSITSPDDSSFRTPKAPLSVGRKTKGTKFTWLRTNPNSVSEHWVYLELPSPMKHGATYVVNTGALSKNGKEWKLAFDETKARSEAVHVNTLGYVPSAPEKFGYLYQWMGDRGSLDLAAFVAKQFNLIDITSGTKAFTGEIRFRMKKEQAETQHVKDSPPYGNFLNADVWECDFSGFSKSGKYALSIDGIGCSWPFEIKEDVYRPAFYNVVRAIYHNRSGIALTKPYTEFERPAPHNTKLTPGFAGKLMYTTVRESEWGSEGGKADIIKPGFKGPLDATWGWYQDAGDWDGYFSHLRIAQDLLFTYEMAPRHFRDGDLNIPESGNGVPDILDEAAWLPRYCHRLRHELLTKKWGTGGVSLRVAGDAFGRDEKVLPNGQKVGQGSWEDTNRIWAVAGEDPWSSYRYAGVAAHLAYLFKLGGIKDPQGVDWTREARETYAWAQAHTQPGDEEKRNCVWQSSPLRDPRAYAAAALFRLTGEKAYETQFIADTTACNGNSVLGDSNQYGPWLYALGGGVGKPDSATRERITAAVLNSANQIVVDAPSKRALRWGGYFGMPMVCGQQTTPMVMNGAVAYTLTKESNPQAARRYLAGLYTTCDYFLGTNALNQTWITGVGPRFPLQIFHMDAWYNGLGRFQPGLIPYGQGRKETAGVGPWDRAWPHHTVYPEIDQWPGNERWFNNRPSPLSAEFTIHQQNAPAAAIFGFLCGDAVAPAKAAAR